MKVEVFDKRKRTAIYLLSNLIFTILLLAAGYMMASGWTAMMAYLRSFL